jgi:Ca2+-binding EF-hand superfamily protein
MKELFERYDADKSGGLDKAEFKLFLKELAPILKSSGIKDMDEVKGAKAVDVLFETVDESFDPDGKVSFFEFKTSIEFDLAKLLTKPEY